VVEIAPNIPVIKPSSSVVIRIVAKSGNDIAVSARVKSFTESRGKTL
jgi:hypothetical protein